MSLWSDLDFFTTTLDMESAVEEKYQKEYDRYSDVGKVLKEQEAVQKTIKSIRKDQQSVVDSKSTYPPFYFIEGHSGVGKTQFPFAIRAGGVDAVHLVMTMNADNLQPVYRCLISKSTLFRNAVEYDLGRYRFGSGDVTVDELGKKNNPLQSIAFIQSELKRHGFADVANVHCSPMALRVYVIEKQRAKKSLPVFFLDEVLSSIENIQQDAEKNTKFRFTRNIFSAAGLIVVLMGTNSKAANFTPQFSYSRPVATEGYKYKLWCRIITELPNPNEDSLQCFGVHSQLETLSVNHRALSNFLISQCLKCTPWFVQLLSEALGKILSEGTHVNFDDKQIMDQIFKHMAEGVKATKEFSSGRFFIFGQVAMHLAWHKADRQSKIDNQTGNEAAIKADCFVSHHFARPKGGNFNLYIESGRTESKLRDDKGHEYVAEAYYRGAESESFMYLMFGGGPKDIDFLPPFREHDNQTRLTSNGALTHCRHDVEDNGKSLKYKNDRSRSRDGTALEAMAVLAMEMASHAGGTGGLPVHQFLGFLAVELLPSYCPDWKWQSDACSPSLLMPEVSDSTVPYLSSANDSWPADIHAIPSCCFGNLIRPENSEEIDLAVTVKGSQSYEITGEAKNHENGLSLDLLRKILAKVPQGSRLHLVFTSKVQQSYFNHPSPTWSQYKESHPELQDLALLKLEVELNGPDSLSFRLTPLFEGCNSECSSYHRYLVVYPVDVLCNLQTEWSTNRSKAGISALEKACSEQEEAEE